MSLTPKDLQTLQSLLLPDRLGQQNLGSISTLVQKQFGKSEYYKICRILVFLLRNDFLYDQISRFAALYIIFEICKSGPPGLLVFLDFIKTYLQVDSANKLPWSALFVLHTIMTQPEQLHEFVNYTPSQIANLPVSCGVHELDWNLVKGEAQQQPLGDRLPTTAACGISGIIPDKDIPSSLNEEYPVSSQLRYHCLESLLSQHEPVASQTNLRPEFMRVAPPLLPCPQGNGVSSIDDLRVGIEEGGVEKDSSSGNRISGWCEELIWMNMFVVQHDFHWITNVDDNPVIKLRKLITKALTTTLSQSEHHNVSQLLRENPTSVLHAGITPENLPNLINRSPSIASEVLSVLVNSADMGDYYKALASMDVSVHSLEIVNRLSQCVQLPKEFINSYISKCISDCAKLPEKSAQRHVRLVCVLIQSFIRNKILDVRNDNIVPEVKAFCLEHNNVQKVSSLYRMITSMGSNLD